MMMMILQGSCWTWHLACCPWGFLGLRLSPLMVEPQQAIPYLPPLVAFNDMQENTEVIFYTPPWNRPGTSAVISPSHLFTDCWLYTMYTVADYTPCTQLLTIHHVHSCWLHTMYTVADYTPCTQLLTIHHVHSCWLYIMYTDVWVLVHCCWLYTMYTDVWVLVQCCWLHTMYTDVWVLVQCCLTIHHVHCCISIGSLFLTIHIVHCCIGSMLLTIHHVHYCMSIGSMLLTIHIVHYCMSIGSLLRTIHHVHCCEYWFIVIGYTPKLLGIVIDECLVFSHQTDLLLQTFNQRLYHTKNLCIQGLSKECVNIVFNAIVLGRLTYAIQAWAGYLSQYEIDRVDKFLCKAHRWGLTTTIYHYRDLLYEQDVKLFRAHQQRGHCLSHQLTLKPKSIMSLRPRGHQSIDRSIDRSINQSINQSVHL